jgi:hypothetical protein
MDAAARPTKTKTPATAPVFRKKLDGKGFQIIQNGLKMQRKRWGGMVAVRSTSTIIDKLMEGLGAER